MKRTQLYLDADTSRMLAAEGQRRGTTVSALVREAVAAAYGRGGHEDRRSIIARVAGAWADRDDIGNTEAFVRRVRRSARTARWSRGRGAKVPPRQ